MDKISNEEVLQSNDNHFTALFPGPPGWAGDRRSCGLSGARDD